MRHTFIMAFVLISCVSEPLRIVTPPDTDKCGDGCARLKDLGCPEAAGSEPSDPDSCRKDCEYIQREGGVNLSVACWSTIATCGELETKCRDDVN